MSFPSEILDYKKCDDSFCVTPAFTSDGPECCEPVICCEEKPVLYCCEKKPPKVVYCCDNKEVVYSCKKKPSGAPENCDKKSSKVVYCCKKEPPKVVYCCEKTEPKRCCDDSCKPTKTKYIMPCYRYEDGRIVEKLPVSAFKRNGMQDQEHSKLLGTVNFLVRCPRDVSIECEDVCNFKVGDPAKVACYMRKKPVENQPTVLMRRACEVACGRRKPFVASSYHMDADHTERRYHSEDEKGNLCFHYERIKPENSAMNNACCDPVPVSTVCRPCKKQFVSCIPVNPCCAPKCCYYFSLKC